jgi:S-ribosylhomocysteine lyase
LALWDFLVRDMSQDDALALIKETVLKCKNHTGEIPGNTAAECGNYKEHNFEGAIKALNKYYDKLKDLTIDNLKYN